jgi:DNA repair ATPase RecN
MEELEEKRHSLERSLAWLEKKFNSADIQGINHHAAMLLGLAYKQQDDTREIEETLREHSSKLDEHTTILNEHSSKLDEHTTILNEHSSKFASIEHRLEKIEAKTDKQTEAINENTKILSQILATLNKFNGY